MPFFDLISGGLLSFPDPGQFLINSFIFLIHNPCDRTFPMKLCCDLYSDQFTFINVKIAACAGDHNYPHLLPYKSTHVHCRWIYTRQPFKYTCNKIYVFFFKSNNQIFNSAITKEINNSNRSVIQSKGFPLDRSDFVQFSFQIIHLMQLFANSINFFIKFPSRALILRETIKQYIKTMRA